MVKDRDNFAESNDIFHSASKMFEATEHITEVSNSANVSLFNASTNNKT